MSQTSLRVAVRTVLTILGDVGRLGLLALHSRTHLAAEKLFLRKQLALYLERQVKPRRADDATRITLVALSRLVPWRDLLTIVKPDTLIRWHRKGFRLLWRWKSQTPGRPPVPEDLGQPIAEMATANRTWSEERIAVELPREAWDSRVAAHRQALHAFEADATPEERLADVEHVRAESRAVRAGV